MKPEDVDKMLAHVFPELARGERTGPSSATMAKPPDASRELEAVLAAAEALDLALRVLAAKVSEQTGVTLPISDPPTIGEQVAVYRLAIGLTQEGLAFAATARRRAATVADVEAGRGDGRNPKAELLRGLARALVVPLVIFPVGEEE